MTRLLRASALLLLLLLASPPGPAAAEERTVVVVEYPGLVETALASCAGGAVIGVIVVAAGGVGQIGPTAGLFCGLSAAAAVVSTATAWTWRAVTGLLR
jgi:hypothetical protein